MLRRNMEAQKLERTITWEATQEIKEKETIKFKDQDTTIFPNKIRKEDKIASIFGQRS